MAYFRYKCLNFNETLTNDVVSFGRPGPGPAVLKLFSCSAHLSMKFSLLINVKMPTIVGILIFMSRKNSILGLYI